MLLSRKYSAGNELNQRAEQCVLMGDNGRYKLFSPHLGHTHQTPSTFWSNCNWDWCLWKVLCFYSKAPPL